MRRSDERPAASPEGADGGAGLFCGRVIVTPSSASTRSLARPPDFSTSVIDAGPETAIVSPARNSMFSSDIAV